MNVFSSPLPPVSPTHRLLLRGGTILSMDPAVGDFARGDILLEGSRIVQIGAKLTAPDAEVIDATGMIVLPGFIDAHRHAWQGSLRQLMPNVNNLGDYVNATHFSLAKHYRPQDMYVGNLLTALSCLDAGITTVIDASHNARSAAHSEAALDALEAAGIRALYAAGAPIAGEWANHWPHDLERLQQARFASPNSLLTLGMVSQPDRANWAVARRLGLRIVTELLGPDMAAALESLHAEGLLGPDNVFNHCTALPESAWRMLREAGAHVTVDARSDAQYGLGEGVFAYQHAVDHDLKPGLGTDLETSFGGDMFTEMRVAFSLQRAVAQNRRFASDAAAPQPVSVRSILEAATINGAHCAGLGSTTGSLTPGKEADLVLLRIDDLHTFPSHNALGTVVHAADRSNVDTVIVGGRIRKSGGKLVGLDRAKLNEMTTESLTHLFAASGYLPNILAEEFTPLPGDMPAAWTGI